MPNRIKSVETALEWTKQITTLASGVLVVSGTFIKDLFDGKVQAFGWLILCWLSLCVCILFGVLFMGSLCSILEKKEDAAISIYSQPAQALGFIHFAGFFLAVICFAVFTLTNISERKSEAAKTVATNSPIVVQIQFTNAPIVVVTNTQISNPTTIVSNVLTLPNIYITNNLPTVIMTSSPVMIVTNWLVQQATNDPTSSLKRKTEVSIPLFKYETR
jgi:hypothetical protein